jgi:ribonuclease-3 family protein
MHEKIIGARLPSSMALAYLGDARHSLFVRDVLVRRGLTKSRDLNREAQKYVTAEAQARMYRRIEPMLTEDESDTFRRAANSSHLNRPKHASLTEYRHATGFEALLGMLYFIGDEERLIEILTEAHKEIDDDTEN